MTVGAREALMHRTERRMHLPFGLTRCAASAAMGRAVRAHARPARVGWPARPAILGALAALLAGCARDAEPRTFAVPAAAAARIRMVCPPGTFIGTMTTNCPQPLPRGAPAQ